MPPPRARVPGRTATALAIVLLAASIALTAWTVATLGFLRHPAASPYLPALGALWLLFAVALLALRGVRSTRTAVVLVLVGGAALGGAGLAGPPDTSTDSARYAWDGIVLDAGISPYRFVPADARLERLRPGWLFPTATVAADGSATCPGGRFATTREVHGDGSALCTAINRPSVHTIYPPAGELLFAAVRAVVPRSVGFAPFQVLGLLASLGVTALLLVVLRRRGLDPRWAALWAWCPMTVSEAVTNSHVDAVGALVALGATVLVVGRRPLRGGVLLGVAAAIKLIPVLVAPPLLRRTPIRIGAAALVTIAVCYLPFVLRDGAGVLGYLPGYLHEEGYDSGGRSVLVSLLVPGPAATLVAGLLLAAVVAVVMIRTRPDDPWLGQLLIVGSALVLLSPRYAWYGLLLLPWVAATGRIEWLAVGLALQIGQLVPGLAWHRIALGAAVLVVLTAALLRRRAARVPGSGRAAALRTDRPDPS